MIYTGPGRAALPRWCMRTVVHSTVVHACGGACMRWCMACGACACSFSATAEDLLVPFLLEAFLLEHERIFANREIDDLVGTVVICRAAGVANPRSRFGDRNLGAGDYRPRWIDDCTANRSPIGLSPAIEREKTPDKHQYRYEGNREVPLDSCIASLCVHFHPRSEEHT